MKKLILAVSILALSAMAAAANKTHTVSGIVSEVSVNSHGEAGGCTILMPDVVTTPNCTSSRFSVNCNGAKHFKERPVDTDMAKVMLGQAQISLARDMPVDLVVFDGLVYPGGVCVVKSITLK